MQERKFHLPDQQNHFITSYALDKLLKKADGDACLMYLYFLKRRGSIVISEAMNALRLSEQQVYDTMGQLAKLGLISGQDVSPRKETKEKVEETPQYSAAEIKKEIESDKEFASLLKEVEGVLGKVLTAPDLNILISIYRHLGMPSEVIYQLVCHLTAEHKERYGAGRSPTMRGIEKIAYIWVRDDIITLDAAMEHITKREQLRTKVGQVKKMMNLRQEKLSPTQENYIHAWLDMGFDLEVIATAYDKTLVQAGEMKWPYMNAILNNWHEKGLYTQDAVETQDGAGRKKASVQKKTLEKAVPNAKEVERRRKLMIKMEGG